MTDARACAAGRTRDSRNARTYSAIAHRHAQRLRWAVASLVLVALGCAGLQFGRGTRASYSIQGKDFVFPSGLRLFFEPDYSQPSAMVTTVVGVGSAADPPGKEGLAHLVEHLWFRAEYPEGLSVGDRLVAFGGSFKAYTARDTTTFYVVAAGPSLPALLQLEAARLTARLAGVRDEVFVREREVVRNELRQFRETTVGGRVNDVLMEMLYPLEHTYHRPIIGTHASLDTLTLTDARAFADAHYRADNTTIVVTGDFVDARALIAQAFPISLLGNGHTIAAPRPRCSSPSPEPPPPDARLVRHESAAVTRTAVHLAWSLPGGFRQTDALAQVAALLAGHPLSARPDFVALGGLGHNDFERWFEQTLAPANAVLVLVGVFDPDEAERRVRERFSAWRNGRPGAPLAPLPPAPAASPRALKLIHRPGMSQTDLRLTCRLAAAASTDLAAVEVTRRYVRDIL